MDIHRETTHRTTSHRMAKALGTLHHRTSPDGATSPGPGPVLTAVERLEQASQADPLIELLRRAVRAVPLGPARDLLHGRPLGHPAHPLLVQVPIGTWLSAAVLDLLPGQRAAAHVLIGTGLAAAAPAAAAGWADWAELPPEQARTGLVHALGNTTAIALYTASFVARARGRTLRGKALALAGLATVGAAGALGGHLAYRQAAGANHAEQVEHLVRDGWHHLGSLAGFPLGRATRARVDGVDVLVVREDDGTVRALADRCAHMGGPLSEGEIADGCVRCPWHGSVFRLSDGWNVRGPATAPQPAFETRVVDGRVEARLRHDHDPRRRRRTTGPVTARAAGAGET
ncbi:Rieske 2Fe-2S domain-containing protein [Streptomyces antimicrobicus]|uniref:Rieske 2Fe-2S domain-containing protein n=1 Tax=Streptomyces antimicrobicus TaxID=2883108 RepID=A0ABS8B2F5_9ACTN|nr:Rieske 2Fe-2S domain-containing protein [Streptomyces antimicrobicus]MCB5178773.1 Rieske 2Fe-2S domain-containing protein [Streptomyces antimicrobicus]